MEDRDIVLRREPGYLARSMTAFLLRAGLGMFLLMAGLQKYGMMTPAPAAPAPEAAAAADDELIPEDAPAVVEEPVAPADAEAKPKWPGSVADGFKGNPLEAHLLSPAMVDAFLRVLPYAEMAFGALLILGLFTGLTAFGSGLLLLALLLGNIALGQASGDLSKVPTMFVYLLTNAGILWLSPVTSNYFSLDGLLFGWFWKPKTEGEYAPV